MEFIVLTGFLGSGKTTLLRDFLATEAAADTAVIVNEVGEIGLDGAILAEGTGEVPMTMLANGCICCRIGSDLADTVDALVHAQRPAGAPPLRRIVVETSGLSKPGPILRQLVDLAALRLRVAVVATYDALRGTGLADFDEAVAQWAAAHRIVVTKLDCVSADDAQLKQREAEGINPLADVVADTERSSMVAQAFAPLQAQVRLALFSADPAVPHRRIAVRRLAQATLPTYAQLATWLDNLAGVLGERLLRVKGLVKVEGLDRPMLVESVGTLFAAPRPFGVPGSPGEAFLIVIARDLEPGEIEAIAPALLFRIAS